MTGMAARLWRLYRGHPLSFITEFRLMWRLFRDHPEWTILRLRHGWRAYRLRPSRNVHAGTLRALARRITVLDARDAGLPS